MTNTAASLKVTFEPVDARTLRVVTDRWAATVRRRSFDVEGSARSYYKTSRVYGGLAATVPGFNAEETRLLKAITNHDVKDPALAKFQRASIRRSNVELQGMVLELLDLLAQYGFQIAGLASLGSDPLTTKFSIKAGCSMCPCSPGHVANATIRVNGRPVDFDFDAVLPPVDAETPAAV